MARPAKKGLDYFPFDVGFFEDIKIKRLKSRYGTDGICLYLYLLTQIYAEGYYLKINNEEDFYDDINDTLLIEEGKARQIIKYCSDRSMIVEIIPGEIGSPQAQNVPVQGVKVLTAAGIQMRYAEVMKGRKKDITDIKGEFWLLDEKKEAELDTYYKSTLNEGFSENNDSFSENNTDNSEINSTNKIKLNKTKLNEIKSEEERKQVRREEGRDKQSRDKHCACVSESYDEIVERYEINGEAERKAVFEFVKHCQLNGHTLTNDALIRVLDCIITYPTEAERVKAIYKAIDGGKYVIPRNLDRHYDVMGTDSLFAKKSYQEIIDSFSLLTDTVKKKIWEFIQHCKANGQTLSNDRLHQLCSRLAYSWRMNDDKGRLNALDTAIRRGYYDIKEDDTLKDSLRLAADDGKFPISDDEEDEDDSA